MKELTHYVVPTLQQESFNSALIHIGINDILKDQSDLKFESLTRNILEISQQANVFPGDKYYRNKTYWLNKPISSFMKSYISLLKPKAIFYRS